MNRGGAAIQGSGLEGCLHAIQGSGLEGCLHAIQGSGLEGCPPAIGTSVTIGLNGCFAWTVNLSLVLVQVVLVGKQIWLSIHRLRFTIQFKSC